jgi:hypothetical protein
MRSWAFSGRGPESAPKRDCDMRPQHRRGSAHIQ